MWILGVAAAALVFCAYGSPWSFSWQMGALVTSMSVVPIVYLSRLAMRCRNEALYRLKSSLDERQFFDSRLMSNADHWRTLLRDSRENARLAAMGESARLPPLDLPDGLSRDAMTWLQHRYAAGESLCIDSLRDSLEGSALIRVDKLNRFFEQAFGWGVLGAILGLGAQVMVVQRMTEGGFLASGFMAGVVLKAAVSVVGATVAFYARSLRWRQLERYDELTGRLEEFVTTQIGSLFRDAGIEDGDFGTALRDAAERIERMGKSLEERLPQLIGNVVMAAAAQVDNTASAIEARLPGEISDAVMRGLSGIRGVIAEELGAALRTNVTQPFRTEMIEMTNSVKSCTQSIQEASGKFRDSMNSLEREVRAAISERETALRNVTETVNVLQTVPTALENVVREIRQSVREMEQYRGELEHAIGTARNHNPGTPGNGHALHEHIQLADKLLEALRTQYGAPARHISGQNIQN
jgi:hypothetical protein